MFSGVQVWALAGQFMGMQRATVDEQYSNWILSDVTLGVEKFCLINPENQVPGVLRVITQGVASVWPLFHRI